MLFALAASMVAGGAHVIKTSDALEDCVLDKTRAYSHHIHITWRTPEGGDAVKTEMMKFIEAYPGHFGGSREIISQAEYAVNVLSQASEEGKDMPIKGDVKLSQNPFVFNAKPGVNGLQHDKGVNSQRKYLALGNAAGKTFDNVAEVADSDPTSTDDVEPLNRDFNKDGGGSKRVLNQLLLIVPDAEDPNGPGFYFDLAMRYWSKAQKRNPSNFTVMTHPNTGCLWHDHRDWATWLQSDHKYKFTAGAEKFVMDQGPWGFPTPEPSLESPAKKARSSSVTGRED